MKIKKLAAAAMAGIMVLGMGTSVSAETLSGSTLTTNPKNVQAKYATSEAADIVYSVDITWGALQYIYTVASEGTWNPMTHDFNDKVEGTWGCEEGDNVITVTNHSNAGVTVAFSYTPENAYNSITGSFTNSENGELSDNQLELATAEGTLFDDAPEDTAKLSLDGALNKSVDTATTIGTVTVTLVTPPAV